MVWKFKNHHLPHILGSTEEDSEGVTVREGGQEALLRRF